ncbi:hypothetical protein F3Y22_tig00112285pilonHSYRG00060 [Hibiscus syriacus]|uniref:Uncharacterized protein n=1 Tax=Hibiscus syriacus TaxID=106335 RepID=A0A6A2Y9Z3_HIBSY|nr:hypothetical protein F3Y22_tig00112285pilonHSYRG00060 [Hibiscus syriacus]
MATPRRLAAAIDRHRPPAEKIGGEPGCWSVAVKNGNGSVRYGDSSRLKLAALRRDARVLGTLACWVTCCWVSVGLLNLVISAQNEVVDSIDRDELAKFFSLKCDPEDEDAELFCNCGLHTKFRPRLFFPQKIKNKMETTRDQLAGALYQKGLAMAEIESVKGEKAGGSDQPDLFEENFKELTKWGEKAGGSDQPDLFEENFKELTKWDIGQCSSLPRMIHLFFTFSSSTIDSIYEADLANAEIILSIFDLHSGHAINKNKFKIFFSENTNLNIRNEICAKLDYEKISDMGVHLKVPVRRANVSNDIYNFLLDKIQSKLDGWSVRTLSFAGRIILAKFILSSIPSYLM